MSDNVTKNDKSSNAPDWLPDEIRLISVNSQEPTAPLTGTWGEQKSWAGSGAPAYVRLTPERAAATDMLEALQATRIILAEHEPHPLPVLAKVLAAIAKATGDAQ